MSETCGTDIAQIAAGLTDAQRRAILSAKDLMFSHDGYPFFSVKHTGEPWPEGVAQFLTISTDRLAPLGLAVREHLEKK